MHCVQILAGWRPRVASPLAPLAAAAAAAACGPGAMASGFVATHLVSNINTASNPYSGSNVDTHLVNAWGIAFNPQGFVWVANNGTSTSTLYDGNGVPQSLVVAIPPGAAGSASPTGIVFNGSQSFQVTQGGVSGASAFIFVGEAGTVSAWSPGREHEQRGPGRRRRGASEGLQGPRHRQPGRRAPALRRPTSTTASSMSSTPTSRRSQRRRVHRCQPAGRLRAVRHPGDRQPDLRQLREAGRAGAQRGRRRRPRRGRRIRYGGQPREAADRPRRQAQRALGHGAWRRPTSARSATPARRQLRRRQDQRVRSDDRARCLGTLAGGNGTAIAIDGLWGIAFGNGINAQPTNTLFYAAGPADEGATASTAASTFTDAPRSHLANRTFDMRSMF